MRTARILGLVALAGLVATVALGLWVTPPDQVMGNLVRLLYLHPAVAWVAYLAFGVTALTSALYLWPRTRSMFWDRLGASSAEIGVVFCAITLITGSIWGRGSWGVWWTWDARLTLTALLFAVFVGYLALRRTGGDPDSRARRCSIAAVVAAVLVPVDHEATTWWQTLHQGNTIFKSNPSIHGWQLVTLLVSFLAYALLFAWLLVHRYRVEVLEDRFEEEGFAAAIAERRAEAGGPAAPAGANAAPRVGAEAQL